MRPMHWIQALVARRNVLTETVTSHPGSVVRLLPQVYGLVPLTDDFSASLSATDLPLHDPLPMPAEEIPPGVCAYAARLSMQGPVAFIATYIFGGTGGQDAVVWDRGEIVATFHEDEDSMSAWPDSSISRALRYMGVVAQPSEDEFDALGLGTHRSTEDWAKGSEEIFREPLLGKSRESVLPVVEHKPWWKIW